MRSIWFGDNRDIVKWSTLLHIAQDHNLRHVVQICFLNPNDFPPIIIDGKEVPVPASVLEHFRDVTSVKNISSRTLVAVFDEPFSDRAAYLYSALKFISKYQGQKCVFLDPDTGLAPNKADKTHVTDAEVAAFWSSLAVGDVLAIYQHKTNRNGNPWVEEKQRQLAAATNVDPSQIKIAKSHKIAHDVVFFYAVKV